MTDQILRGKSEEENVNDLPLYEVVDEKSKSAYKDSNNDYSMLSMSTLTKDGIYVCWHFIWRTCH
jgi:hypothetical protein